MAYSKARLLMLLGDEIDGNIAHKIGLADYLARSESGLQKIIDELKSKVKQCSPNAIAITKANMPSNQSIDIEKASKLFYHCIEHSEGQEGLQSFFEKRKPYWTKDNNKKY
jgi:enoyl-CoA hydratase/carnithine racemase